MVGLADQNLKAHGWPGASTDAAIRTRATSRSILAVRNWLATKLNSGLLPGGQRIATQFQQFQAELPELATAFGQAVEYLSFYDLHALISLWLTNNC